MNSLPDETSFVHYLQDSLTHMQGECPPAYAQLCQLLAPRQVQLSVDREELWMGFAPAAISVQPGQAANASVHIRLPRQVILDMLDAKLTLQDAILTGRVSLQGDLHHLTLFYEGWLTYLRGAVRCPSIPDLLERYRYVSSPVE